MQITCYQCDTKTNLDVGFEVKNFVCPNCHSLFLEMDGKFRFDRKFEYKPDDIGLHAGQKGTLKGIEYTITGILTKQAYGSYYWAEYILIDAQGQFVFLSLADGHWILLHEVEDKYDIRNHPRTLTYNDIHFNLYEYSETKVVSAEGFFDFQIPKKEVKMTDYIQPPYIISIEEFDTEEATYFGEHISSKEVQKAFSLSAMPSKTGTGIVQPFLIDFKNLGIVFCVSALLILCSHWLIYKNTVEKNVLYGEFAIDALSQKDFISNSFILEGGSAPLTISANTNVDNSWANIQVTLINEKNNEEIYANKDIEYYHGYTDGENWTEGSSSEKFNICGVSAGKYHLVINLQKQPSDYSNNYLKVNVVWNQPSMRNVWIPILLMIGIYIGLRYLKLNFEQKRWEESSYSPYNTD